MEISELLSTVQSASILIAVLVGCGTLLRRQNGKVSDLTEMRTDIKYIKETVSKINPMEIKLAEVEASAKQAHKRIDDYLNRRKGGGYE